MTIFQATEAPGAITPPYGRGCGSRSRGAAYAECGLSEDGLPLEAFLIDPPRDSGDLILPTRGVLPIVLSGVTHVADRVGRAHYPYVADFLEEGRRYGFSRKLPPSFDFTALGTGSTLLFAHDDALITNPQELVSYLCPTHWGHQHAKGDLCIGACWCVVDGLPLGQPPADLRVRRTCASFSYTAWGLPTGVTPQTRCAFFLRVPITRLAVVRGNNHEKVLARAQQAGLPVVETDA
ncbi:MAG: hypothetical protein NVSMB65_19020 [Chloroflexota bacterium]